MIRLAVVIPLLLLFPADAAWAQVRGSVVDTAGAPVPGVTVEAWAGLRRVASARSDASGLFALGDGSTEVATGLVVRRVGYRRLAVALAPADSVVRLRLTAQAVTLAGVTAVAPTRACPNRDDPRARAAWEAARAKYPPMGDTMVFHSLATFYRGEVAREEIDGVGDGAGSRGWSAGGTVAWPMWRRQIRAGGYAVRLARPFGDQYALWEYAPLEMVFAQHFADRLFGELHTLSVVAMAGGETTLRFCPRREGPRGRAEIEGTLTLSAGGALLGGRWRYRTPNPDEDAGGEVDFLPPEVTTRSLLLPERSLFWRRVAGGTRYHVEGERFQEWRLFPGSAAPPPPAEIFETVRLPSP